MKNKQLSGNVYIEQDMRGVDFTHAIMNGAKFIRCDLRGADMIGVVMNGCELTGSNLRGVNLTNSCLRGAVLTDADLTGATLTDCDLTGAVMNKKHDEVKVIDRVHNKTEDNDFIIDGLWNLSIGGDNVEYIIIQNNINDKFIGFQINNSFNKISGTFSNFAINSFELTYNSKKFIGRDCFILHDYGAMVHHIVTLYKDSSISISMHSINNLD